MKFGTLADEDQNLDRVPITPFTNAPDAFEDEPIDEFIADGLECGFSTKSVIHNNMLRRRRSEPTGKRAIWGYHQRRRSRKHDRRL